tara:strand:+ start:3024 stop:3200 length:177 start_codon:yes stop_codon:yes gene_type:complete
MEEERKELESIEHQKRTYKSKFMREQAIWDEIAMNINGYKGKKQKYWCRVMELYNKKY